MVALSRDEAKGTVEASLWDTPEHWPRNIRIIPLDSFDMFGEDPRTHEVYWNGEPIVLKRRFENFERGLAVVGLSIAGLGSIAAFVQALVLVGQTVWGWGK